MVVWNSRFHKTRLRSNHLLFILLFIGLRRADFSLSCFSINQSLPENQDIVFFLGFFATVRHRNRKPKKNERKKKSGAKKNTQITQRGSLQKQSFIINRLCLFGLFLCRSLCKTLQTEAPFSTSYSSADKIKTTSRSSTCRLDPSCKVKC